MSHKIRIGTRESELALWQAKTVQQGIEALGHEVELVPIKSKGDQNLHTPLYEFGITGVFTKALDIALLEGTIDLAVHSMKDVPTKLPQGICQTAVLKRGVYQDVLVLKNGEEFLKESSSAQIATGSLRRSAFWRNRYPQHCIEALRGNVNTRLQKLRESSWDGAIFAMAGLERIGKLPSQHLVLDWMLPAPAQGIIMLASRSDDHLTREATAPLNDESTSIMAQLERSFLSTLEGGCTAPIGALASIDDNQIHLKGALLNIDGSQCLTIEGKTTRHDNTCLGEQLAKQLLREGGQELMKELQEQGYAKNS